MPEKISIIGAAGTLGSCAAYAVATQGLCDELVLFDINENLLKSHTLDLKTAVTSIQDVTVKAADSDEDLADSHVVIVAAGAPWRFIESRMELLKDSLPIITEVAHKIKTHCPQAIVISATNPVDPLELCHGFNDRSGSKAFHRLFIERFLPLSHAGSSENSRSIPQP